MFDVVALGELLIDFTPCGISSEGNEVFERNPGGAPANVLVQLSKLKKSTAFLGMVGKDQFGTFLRNVLNENGVNTEGLMFSDSVNTTLAFVHLNAHGERNFSFYRNPGADMMFNINDINYNIIKNSKIFHFGSLSLTDEPAKSATLAALKFAKEQGKLISYDPNLRPPLWKNLEEAREEIIKGLYYADIIKVSEEELEFITGANTLEKGTNILFNMGISIVLVTLGEKGCFYRYTRGFGKVDGFKVNAIDTTGAGDSFLGAVLSKICSNTLNEINGLTIEEFEDIIRFSNAIAALVTTKKGAIPAMIQEKDLDCYFSKIKC